MFALLRAISIYWAFLGTVVSVRADHAVSMLNLCVMCMPCIECSANCYEFSSCGFGTVRVYIIMISKHIQARSEQYMTIGYA